MYTVNNEVLKKDVIPSGTFSPQSETKATGEKKNNDVLIFFKLHNPNRWNNYLADLVYPKGIKPTTTEMTPFLTKEQETKKVKKRLYQQNQQNQNDWTQLKQKTPLIIFIKKSFSICSFHQRILILLHIIIILLLYKKTRSDCSFWLKHQNVFCVTCLSDENVSIL